jgi:hypothetical protein
MNVIVSRSTCHRLGFAFCAVLFAACSSSSNGGGGTMPTTADGFGAKFKLADNEVQGWTQSTASDAYTVYTDITLTDKIDGAATPYVEHGMKLAMYQNMVGPDPSVARVVAMAFGTAAQAQAMVSQRVADQGADVPIPGYAASIALAWTTIGGITAVASFNALYLEIILSGFDTPDAAGQVAAKFLQAMEAKTK